ncbi:aminoglycoside phosphotransferase family protein [Pseudoalteromonas phenolica]|uniref:Putative phosphotransferase n=1 Tax=Pseudoalteromonas phenolica TaxID=161398 RepID=A0A0S2JZR7_9GAMM|nr:phosphotransferase [Pseudoalteromonas phenolica]ALO41505.1 putative phosphotransferase [Pseudoalteromonas phenolica]MBE0353949.1 hypothetical protein [Pseudoalteromonas phenolica O-BC30]
MIKSDNRKTQLDAFLAKCLEEQPFSYQAITSDASFRQYYRVITDSKNLILMDSPVELIDNRPFVGLQQDFAEAGLVVPQVIAKNLELGFILLSDLGAEHLADRLSLDSRISEYKTVLDLLPQIASIAPSQWMKPYDKEFIRLEITIFKEWLLERWLGIELSREYSRFWHELETVLVDIMLEQPQVTMHRDFHSRNIMKTSSGWALIDFQDAVQGPISYDAVSLLKDCYFTLPKDEFEQLLKYNYELMSKQEMMESMSFEKYCYYFHLTGLQRHLKASGIFCRLFLRDNKKGYLQNILPTLSYVYDVCTQYEQFQWLATWLDNEIIPLIKLKLEPQL